MPKWYKGNVILGVILVDSDPEASNMLNLYLKYYNITVHLISCSMLEVMG